MNMILFYYSKRKKMNEYMLLIIIIKNGTHIFFHIPEELAWMNEFDNDKVDIAQFRRHFF